MRRAALAAYAGFAYAAFLAAVIWAVGFFADVGLPTTIDRGAAQSLPAALLIDAGLLLLFALQHSAMARAGFKRALTRLVPEAAERSTYVLAASSVLLLLFWQWRPLTQTLWRLDWSPATAAVDVFYVAGWLIVISSTFMIDHLDFLGLRQAVLFARRRAYRPPEFKERWMYAWIRHPMMAGLIVVFWAAPKMSVGHILFAVAATAYILAGTVLEERDLRATMGAAYRGYALRVPAFIPMPRIRRV